MPQLHCYVADPVARKLHELRKQPAGLRHATLRIAAIALARDLTLVTANTRDFGRVTGLRFENWE